MNKLTQIKKKEFQHLRVIIQALLGVDVVNDTSRVQHNVNARIIYSNILRQQGFGCSLIASSINKNHATILHYFKQFKWYLKTDEELSNGYSSVMKEYGVEYNPIYSMTDQELKKKLISLTNENKKLYSSNEILLEQINKEKTRQKRLQDIYSLIDERTRKGSEEEVLSKLKTFYNGVYDYRN